MRHWLRPFVSPQVFDFWAGRVNTLWTWERPLARVVGREAVSRDAVTLLLKPNRHWSGFTPGQHLNIGVEVDGARLTRSYSLSEPPRADGLLAVTIKRMPGGRVSPILCEQAALGSVVELGPAFGEMTLPASPSGPLLFLAGGSGITPLRAMLRDLAARGMPVPVTLLYWARQRDELCFVDELRALAASCSNLDVHFILTREAARADDERVGRIRSELLMETVPDIAARQVMACGPGGFVESARALLDGRVAGFRAEAFSLPEVPVGDEGEVELTLARSGRTLRAPRGKSLLEVLEAEGLRPKSGCRMGICNTCACGKSAGSVRHLPSGALVHENTQALKLCIHSAATDLSIDL